MTVAPGNLEHAAELGMTALVLTAARRAGEFLMTVALLSSLAAVVVGWMYVLTLAVGWLIGV